MKAITCPLKPQMERPEVVDLQDALQLLIERGVILANEEAARQELSHAFKDERVKQTYGGATTKLVGIFQEERKLPVSGDVDESTAQALNTLLGRWGFLSSRPTNVPIGLGVKPLNISPDALTSKSIGELHIALQKLKIGIQPSDLARKEMGPSTVQALRAFQERVGLPADGNLTPDTVARLDAELAHSFVTDSKVRTQRLQGLLQRIGQQIDPEEIKNRQFGPGTEQALKQFQASAGMSQDGRISNEALTRLREDALKARLTSKSQVAQMHRILLRALNTAGLKDVRVDANELKGRQLGPSTRAAIQVVQQKYGLPVSGELDVTTYERLVSMAATIPQPVKQLKPKAADEMKLLRRVGRLNMQGQHINDLQNTLAFFDYQIDESEFKSKIFGKSTRAAVLKYQRARGLPVSGHVEKTTLDALNRAIQQANPRVVASAYSYRVRGSVRNELWVGMGEVKLQVWEKLTSGQGKMLVEGSSADNGFFDIPYEPPLEPATKQIKQPFSLQIKALDSNDQEIGSKSLFNPTLIAWVNFTQGKHPYRGKSEFEIRVQAVSKAMDGGNISTLAGVPQQRSLAAQTAGLTPEDVARLVLADLVAANLKHSLIGVDVCYAFIAQNLPFGLPESDRENGDWLDNLAVLTEEIANKLVFMENCLQASALDNAIKLNLMPIAIGLQKDTILAALAQLRRSFALEKPILAGNGSLKALLEAANQASPDNVPPVEQPAYYTAVADAFLTCKNFGPDFWSYLKQDPDQFGGDVAVQRFETIVNLGCVTDNFMSMVSLLKKKIDDPKVDNINSVSDLATLRQDDWVCLIKDNGINIPAGASEENPEDSIRKYAETLVSQSEALFPAVALAATVQNTMITPLDRIKEIQGLLSKNINLDLRRDNLNVFFKEKGKNFQEQETLLTQMRVLQRVHRIAPTAASGQALLELGIHNSAQIISMGKDRFVKAMASKGVEKRVALTIYGLAEHQYAQTLQRIVDYRFDLHRADPNAIIKYTYTADELPPALADVCDLETLFGSLDFCDCPHCQSVYGPPAYLADVLRYLNSHSSGVNDNLSVKDILFGARCLFSLKLDSQSDLDKGIVSDEVQQNFAAQTILLSTDGPVVTNEEVDRRWQIVDTRLQRSFAVVKNDDKKSLEVYEEYNRRPDIGNIKLNCENTETPLPYIDLVCEVLENAIAAPNPTPNFDFQTTRPAAELRAFPENVRPEAYNLLKDADYPLDSSFDLWQEEARVFLQHLGVQRWELMETFQARANNPASPSDTSIAGEYWGMSTHETHIVITQEVDSDRQKVYWGFKPADPLPTKSTVADFMRLSRLDYGQLLDLLYVQWINPYGDKNKIVINRPGGTCNTGEQTLGNLTLNRLDQIHRFLRLWRHTGWAMWELDLLIRATVIGHSQIDDNTLVHLKQIKQLQKRLGLTVEQVLSLFAEINTEIRLKPDDPQRKIQPLYVSLFLNPAVISPVDSAFTFSSDYQLYKPLLDSAHLPDQKPTPPNHLSDHKSTLLAAFALSEPDLMLLLAKIGNDCLTVENLSKIDRRVNLARGMGMGIKDLLTLEALSDAVDIFATPKDLLDFIELAEWVAMSGFMVDELDYLLNYRPDSPYGIREDTITQSITSLREALCSNTATPPDSAILTTQVATAFALPPEQVRLMLSKMKLGGINLITHLSNADLTTRIDSGNKAGEYATGITPANFPNIYNAYRLVQKNALLFTRLKINKIDLEWFLTNAATFKLLDLGALPVTDAPYSPLFPSWLVFYQWLYFERLYPEPEDISLRGVFDKTVVATSDGDIKAAIAKLTQWKEQDLDDLTNGLGFKHIKKDNTPSDYVDALPDYVDAPVDYVDTPSDHVDAPSDYVDIDTYLRLGECFKQIKRIGVSASLLISWTKCDDDKNGAQAATVSQQIRQAAKSKYDYSVWLEKVTPLEDALREKKRDALVNYLVETSLRTAGPEFIEFNGKNYINPMRWRNANELLNYFLIDMEMSACQLTSRIKQAISSTQMFVQRCLLGLEQPFVEVSRAAQLDNSSENSWKQWKWMKNYRLWEANRKVFLYPENWIEPELRDDKSPFFKELESEIMQSDITEENVHAAFLHYIQKVHEVARLDIVGVYYELEDTDPCDDLQYDINMLHVVGRTRAHPAIYYYRRFDLNYGEWTAWEKIDLDIQSDQVIPVVYNRQLYLFWLSFIEKPQKVKKQPPAQPSNDTNVPEVPNQLEMQLAWSVRKDGGWTAKRVSKQKLIHPWQRPLTSYNLKPRYKDDENLLWLDVYISQSEEFNNTRFWDAYINQRRFVTAQHPYDEKAPPWHSSSFVFDGEVVDVKIKGLAGQYHVLDNNGYATDSLTPTTSYTYVHDNFGNEGRAINRLIRKKDEIAPRLPQPQGMHYRNTKLVNNQQTPNTNHANVLENGHTRTLLDNAKSPFEIVFSQHRIAFDTVEWDSASKAWNGIPFFYQDSARAFFIKPEWQKVLGIYNYHVTPFYHPYTALFMRELNRSGVDGLLNRRIQTNPQSYYPNNKNNNNIFDFNSYGPTSEIKPDETVKKDIVDFEREGAYSIYNWEIFFHAPMMIACKLSENQRFEEAMRWFHYIFDPTNTDSPDVPQRYWITKPFFEQNADAYRDQRIENLLKNIEQHIGELTAWKNNPFKPHLIARYRPVAYQKAVVMKYIDNLIAWGDQLFRRDTIEAINEATTLYVLAYEILGRRPVKVPNVQHADFSYNELTVNDALDPFGNKQVEILMENFTEAPERVTRVTSGTESLPVKMFYFGIPDNDQLLDYWDQVEDRLFKIRHCMNIAGVVRQLPLFEPPIDPALLVKAAAAGVDLDSVLANLDSLPSPYRFQRLAQKAVELCSEVRALGDKLLSALEKYDAEGLSLLRSTQEIQLQQAVRQVRKQQIQEANEAWAGLESSKVMAQQKKDFYESREFMNPWEITALSLGGVSALAETTIAAGYVLTGGLALIPRINSGASGFGASPVVTIEPVDGQKLAAASEAAVKTLNAIASAADKFGSLASTVGSYTRRKDEWDFQGQLATTEIAQIEKQIAAAQIRLAIAEKELENHELQIEHTQAVDEYMRSKYTNQQLYDWQTRQVASLYFQSYQLAYDMAKRAEKAFQFEIGDDSETFVQPGYWDSLKKGLLAGERLANDIHRMEAAYLDQNTRDLEITKHVSLAQILPLSLIALKEGGTCAFQLPEWLFDMDYPGHYRRRIKSVSISIPCVVGPYTSVNCTLTLSQEGIRTKESRVKDLPLRTPPTTPTTAIATSHGQNDAGMFELNFNDERFLPFEGAGAVSEWHIDLPQENNQFDLATISDVILHIRYTARAGSADAAKASNNFLDKILPTEGLRLFVLNHEFSMEWQRFLHPDVGKEQILSFELSKKHLPFYARNKDISLTKVNLLVESKETCTVNIKLKTPESAVVFDEAMEPNTAEDKVNSGKQHFIKRDFASTPKTPILGIWNFQIKITKEQADTAGTDYKSLLPDDLQNVYLILGFNETKT